MRVLGGTGVVAVLVSLSAGAAVAGCGGSSNSDGAGTVKVSAEQAALIAQGQTVFGAKCASCHGIDGKPHRGTTGEWGPSFDDVRIREADYVRFRIDYGGYGMPSFRDELSPRQQRAVTAFLLARAGANVAADPDVGDEQVAAGRAVFAARCGGCHGLEAVGPTSTPDEMRVIGPGTDFDVVAPSPQRIRHMIAEGDWWMPSLRRNLTRQQVEDVTAYITKVAGEGRFRDPIARLLGESDPPAATTGGG